MQGPINASAMLTQVSPAENQGVLAQVMELYCIWQGIYPFLFRCPRVALTVAFTLTCPSLKHYHNAKIHRIKPLGSS